MVYLVPAYRTPVSDCVNEIVLLRISISIHGLFVKHNPFRGDIRNGEISPGEIKQTITRFGCGAAAVTFVWSYLSSFLSFIHDHSFFYPYQPAAEPEWTKVYEEVAHFSNMGYSICKCFCLCVLVFYYKPFCRPTFAVLPRLCSQNRWKLSLH